MGKPVERQNHSLSFFILASLIAICTAWAFYEEYLGRRPWKEFQEKTFSYEQEKARSDLRYVERKLESGDLKVVLDPKDPSKTTTVAEAQKRLAELEASRNQNDQEIKKRKRALTEAEIVASDADLKVKLLRSEDDGLFYEFQHAQHQEMLGLTAAKSASAAHKDAEAQKLQKEAEAHGKHRKDIEEARAAKAADIQKAIVDAEAATKQLEQAQASLGELTGEYERLKAAIEAATDPVITARTALTTATKKGTELTQYWLTSYDNSVDRCQNCHATVDKCGFSRPYELIAALNKPGAKPEAVPTDFCVNTDTLDNYKATADAVCALEWDREASEKGELAADKGFCFTAPENRKQVAEFLLNYCGPKVAAVELLENTHHKGACLSKGSYDTLSAYLEDPTQKKGADGKTWSACALTLEPQGESCVEGAAHDQLEQWLRRHCGDTSTTLKGLVEHKAKACAKGEDGKKLAQLKPVLYDLPIWAQTHPHRSDLMGSNHPADRFGCTSCHEGQGAQTKGVAGAEFHHGYDDHYWERPMLALVSHKKFRPQTWGPPPANEGVPGEWVSHEKHYTEATCAKCHVDDVALPYAETYSKGRRLVAEIGCHGCHPVDTFAGFPKIGPTLTDLKKKTTPEFLVKWISYPKSFRPRTKMPNFWPEALDVKHQLRAGSPEEKLRTDEVQKISAYLWKQSDDSALPTPPRGDSARGQALANQVGCRGCHTFGPPEKLCTPEQIAAGKSRGTAKEPGECEVPRGISASDARDFAPNLSNVGLKTNEKWLFAWLKDPTAMWAQTRMPNLRLSDAEAADITAYLLTLKHGEAPPAQPFFANQGSPEFEKAVVEGGKLVSKYGCSGCHDVKGHENDPKIGADLNEYGRKTVDLLDFGNAVPNPRHHSWYNFVDLKLRAPRTYRYERVEAKMPQFDLNDAEVDAVMTFLKSRQAQTVPASYSVRSNERLTAVAHGEQVVEYYNCKGCHVLEGEGGAIRDTYLEDDLAKAPPILQAEGWRTQPDWLFGFLRDPSNQLRPWLDVRMPTFPLSDPDATSVVRGFSAHDKVPYPYVTVKASQAQGKELEEVKAMVAELRCFACHTSGEPAPGQDRSSLAPNLQLARHRLRPDWVSAWIKNPQSLQEGTKMPSFFTPDDPSTVMYPKYFGGSQEKQIEALSDYVMSLSSDGVAGKPQAAAEPRTPTKKKR